MPPLPRTLSVLALLCIAAPAQDPARDEARGQFARVAALVSFPWVLDGTIQAAAADPVDVAVKLFQLDLRAAELQAARLAWLPVGLALQTGFQLGERRRPLDWDDVQDLATAFQAGLSGTYELAIPSLVRAMVGGTVDAATMRLGDEIFVRAMVLHSDLWESHLRSMARRLAGPRAERPPLAVAVVSGSEAETGLGLRNTSGAVLHRVTVRVDSALGTPEQGNVAPHFVFVSEWPAGQEILLAPMTVQSVLLGMPEDGLRRTVEYSVWCDELAAEAVLAELPLARYRRVLAEGSSSYRLALHIDGVDEAGTDADATPMEASGAATGEAAAGADAALAELHAKVREARREGSQRGAILALDRLVRQQPENPVYVLLHGQALGSLGPAANPTAARSALQRFLKLTEAGGRGGGGPSAAAVAQMGRLLAELGDEMPAKGLAGLRDQTKADLKALGSSPPEKLLVMPEKANLRSVVARLRTDLADAIDKRDRNQGDRQDAERRLAKARSDLADAEARQRRTRLFIDTSELRSRIADIRDEIKRLDRAAPRLAERAQYLETSLQRHQERLRSFDDG